MARISQTTINAINERVNFVSLVEQYTRLEKRGHNWWGCCPFHNEKTPSFNVVPDKKMFYCFGCQKGGGIINFLMEIEHLSFVEAVEHLGKKYNIPIEYDGSNAPFEPKNQDKEVLLDLYNRVAGSFHYILTKSAQGKSALDYLRSRDINDDTIHHFQLGYTPRDRNWLYSFLSKKRYSLEILEKSGLFTQKKSHAAFFSGRIMFPITNRHGQVVAFGGRILDGNGPKYLNTGDLPQYKKRETLYAFYQARSEIRKTRSVIICEGYMDVLAFYQGGITNAVAPLGTALTEQQVTLVSSFCETVYLAFDADSAGEAATYKAIKICRGLELDVRVLVFSHGKDPADILKNEGPEGLKNLLKYAILDGDYLIQLAEMQFDIRNHEGKARIAGFLFPYIEVLKSDVQQESFMTRLSVTLEISQKALYADYQNYLRTGQVMRTEETVSKKTHTIKRTAELGTVLVAAANPELFTKLRAQLTADDFEDTVAKELFITLEECFRSDVNNYDNLMAYCATDELRSIVSAAIVGGEFSSNGEEILDDGIQLIKRNSLQRKKEHIIGRLRLIAGKQGVDYAREVNALISEKQGIDTALSKLLRNGYGY